MNMPYVLFVYSVWLYLATALTTVGSYVLQLWVHDSGVHKFFGSLSYVCFTHSLPNPLTELHHEAVYAPCPFVQNPLRRRT